MSAHAWGFRFGSPYLGWDTGTGLPPSFLRPASTAAGPGSPAGTAAGKAQGPWLDSGRTLGTGGAGKRGLARGGFRPRRIRRAPNPHTPQTPVTHTLPHTSPPPPPTPC